MTTFTLTLNADNAAFEENLGAELGRILRLVANRVEEDGDREGLIHDINGNRVGSFEVIR